MPEKLLLGCRVNVLNEGTGKVIRMGIHTRFVGRIVLRDGTYVVKMDDGREITVDRACCSMLLTETK